MSENILDVNKIIVTRQNSSATSAAAPSSLDYGEIALDINGVLRTGNKNGQVITHVVSTDDRLTDTRNPRVTQLSTENLNSITTPGFYYAGGNNTVVNKPSGVDAFGLLVERTAGGFFAQTLTSANQMNGKIFFRQISSGTTWTAWSSFYTTTYKPTLSELGAAAATHTHTKSQITDFPTSLKNPTSIKIQLNGGTTEGTNQFTYDGSAAKNINITPSSIGASASGHTHQYLPLAGGTMTGAITLPGNPTANLHAATKQYVDSKISGAGKGDMLKSVYDTDNDGIVDSSEKVESDGKKTSTTNSTTVDSAANEIPKTGISMYEFYNTTNSPITYANVINVRGRQTGGAGQLALGWEGRNTTPNIFYRAHRDQGNVAWGPWEKIVYESDLPYGKKDIVIAGDSDKYYPVRLSNFYNIHNTAIPATINIIRAYSEQAPDDWNNSTHKGNLQFIIRVFSNGWGGAINHLDWELSQNYSVMVGGIDFSTRNNEIIVYLRGGNAIYHIYGENSKINATAYYETTDLSSSVGITVSPKTYDQISDEYPKFSKGGWAKWQYNGREVAKNILYNANLIGQPNAVTPYTSDNSGRIATTAYVNSFYEEKKSLFLDKDTYDTNNNGIVDKAETLATARTINGTSFNGSANITTANWGTARNITIGDTKKSVNGSADISWSLDEIGALKTYSSISELGYSAATTIQNLYTKMANQSQIIISDINITNPPVQGCIIIIIKYDSQNGYAKAFSKESAVEFTMYSSTTGLSGKWTKITIDSLGGLPVAGTAERAKKLTYNGIDYEPYKLQATDQQGTPIEGYILAKNQDYIGLALESNLKGVNIPVSSSILRCANAQGELYNWGVRSQYDPSHRAFKLQALGDTGWLSCYVALAENIISGSSIRYKKNINPISEELLDSVLKLDVINFEYNEQAPESMQDKKTHYGVIAEQVIDIMPNSVIVDQDKLPTAVIYSDFIPLLLAQVQRQQKQIDDLKERINILETNGNSGE